MNIGHTAGLRYPEGLGTLRKDSGVDRDVEFYAPCLSLASIPGATLYELSQADPSKLVKLSLLG